MEAGVTAGWSAAAPRSRLQQRQVNHLEIGRIGQGLTAVTTQDLVAAFQPAPTAHQYRHEVVGLRPGQGLEGHFDADAGRVAEGDGQSPGSPSVGTWSTWTC